MEGGDKNVRSEMVVMAAHICEYTKALGFTSTLNGNGMVRELHLNKTYFKMRLSRHVNPLQRGPYLDPESIKC